MLIALSPAKTLDLDPAPSDLTTTTRPDFPKDTAALAKIARTLKAGDLRRLMGISDRLADLNVARFQAFKALGDPSELPAALAFAGDVYKGLDARSLDTEALTWAQDRLRILSGLYGLLRPLDLIQPYRLEMGVKLHNGRGDDLYAFWRQPVAKALNTSARDHDDPTLVNLASQEYFKAVDQGLLKLPVLTCNFKQVEADGRLRTIALYAKRARGLMARFAILNRLDRVKALKAFDTEGYRFSAEASDDAQWTFVRPTTPTKTGGGG